MARRGVRATHQTCGFTDYGEFLAVDFCTFLFVTVYERPRTVATGMHSELNDVLAAQSSDFPVTVMGDWNELPHEKAHLTHWYAQEDGQPVASSWASNRCVDYIKTSQLVTCSDLSYRLEHISDHKILQGCLSHSCSLDAAKRMIPTRSFLPGNVGLHDWKVALEQAWANIPAPEESCTEQEWLDFSQLAEHASVCALQILNVHRGRPPCLRPKGSLPNFADHHTDFDFVNTCKICKTFRWRKLAKLLGHVKEYQ